MEIEPNEIDFKLKALAEEQADNIRENSGLKGKIYTFLGFVVLLLLLFAIFAPRANNKTIDGKLLQVTESYMVVQSTPFDRKIYFPTDSGHIVKFHLSNGIVFDTGVKNYQGYLRNYAGSDVQVSYSQISFMFFNIRTDATEVFLKTY